MKSRLITKNKNKITTKLFIKKVLLEDLFLYRKKHKKLMFSVHKSFKHKNPKPIYNSLIK